MEPTGSISRNFTPPVPLSSGRPRWSSHRPGKMPRPPSLTVLADGDVVVEYETYNSGSNQVQVHVANSTNNGASIASNLSCIQLYPADAVGRDRKHHEQSRVRRLRPCRVGQQYVLRDLCGTGECKLGRHQHDRIDRPVRVHRERHPGAGLQERMRQHIQRAKQRRPGGLVQLCSKGDVREQIDTSLT